jgi:hypothetical protein
MSKVIKTVASIGLAIGALALAGPLGGALAFGIAGFGATATLVTATTIIAGIGLSLGAVFIGKELGLNKAGKLNAASIDRLTANLDGQASRKMIVGETAMATDVRYQFQSSDGEYLTWVVGCACHAVESIGELWLDAKKAWDSSAAVTSAFSGYLTVTAETEGVSGSGHAIDSNWTADASLTGCAYLILKFKLTGNSKKAESPFSQSVPTRLTIVGKGMKLPDLREDGVDAADQSTWDWFDDGSGNNPAWQLLAYLIGWRINGEVSVGCGLPSSRLDLDSFTTAANLCDESVTLAGGGTQPRYRSAGIIGDDEDPGEVMDRLCATMNAVLRDDGGRLALIVEHDDLDDPDAISLGADDILGNESWKPVPDTPIPNIVRGRWTDPSDNSLYQLSVPVEKRLTSVDGINRVFPFDAPMVQDAAQFQRLLKQKLQRLQYQGEYSFDCGVRGWLTGLGRIVKMSHPSLGWSDKLFRVKGIGIRQDGRVPLVLVEENAAIHAWDAEDTAPVTPATPTTYDPSLDPIRQAIDDIELTPGPAGAGTWTPVAGTAAIKVEGSTVTKVTTGWSNGAVYSATPRKNGALASFRLTHATHEFVFGLHDSQLAAPNYNSVRYGWLVNAGSSAGAYSLYKESGTAVSTGSSGGGGLGDVLEVAYQLDPGGTTATVTWSVNGTSVHTESVAADQTLYPVFTAFYAGDHLDDCTFGSIGAAGSNGEDGRNNAIVYLYKRASSTPSEPSGTFTYTFSTGALSGGTLNGWTQAIPTADGNPLYVIAATASSTSATDSVPASEFSSAVVLARDGSAGSDGTDGSDGSDGADGLNAATVWLFKRAASAPTVPSSSLTYTFSTGVLSGTLSGWTQAVPANDGNPLYAITATALGTGATDTIATGEWATPQIIAENGANGADGTDGADGASNWTPVAGTAAISVAGKTVTKVTSGWSNGAVYSATPLKNGARAGFRVTHATRNFVFGLDDEQLATPNFNAVRYSMLINAGSVAGNYNIYSESGTAAVSVTDGSGPGVGDVVEVAYQLDPGGATATVTWSVNGTSVHTESVDADQVLYPCFTGFSAGGVLEDCTFGSIGLSGADGLSPVTVAVDPPNATIACNYDGTAKSGELPIEFAFTAYQGGEAIDIDTLTVTDDSGGTFSASGAVVTLSAISALAGGFTATVAAGDQDIAVPVNFTTAISAPPASTAIVDTSNTNVTSTSYTAIGGEITLNASAAGKLKLNLTGSYKVANDGSAFCTLTTKIQIKPAAGSYSDVSGTEKTGTQSISASIGDGGPPYKTTTGGVNGSGPYTVTGLTANASYVVRRMAKKGSGDSNTDSCGLVLSAEPVS